MHRTVTFALLIVAMTASTASAGYPVFSYFARRSDGPYAPQVNRFIVVDPVPAGYGFAPHGGHHAHSQPTELWQRRDLTRGAYPYGWFGAGGHSTQRWTNTGYYENYVEGRTLRGQ